MLLITRREAEAIVINGQIHVKIMEIKGGRVKLGFEFPAGNTVYREELFAKIQEENRAAALGSANTQPLAQVLLNLPRTGSASGNEGKNNEQHHKSPANPRNAGGSDDE
jgi:carbon storage regulator